MTAPFVGVITPDLYRTDPVARRYCDDAMGRLGLAPGDVAEVEVLRFHYRATVNARRPWSKWCRR